MSESRDESPGGSPRSRICRFFCSEKQKKEKDKSSDRKKNEASQTQDETDRKKEEDPPDESPIKTELDSNKLTTLINNSIKEAVKSIVKDGVCDFIENVPSIPQKPKDKQKKRSSELPEDLIPTRDTAKEKSLLNSEEKKTFDSHSKCPRSPRSPKIPKTLTPPKLSEKPPVSQCNSSICPAYTVLDCSKRSKHKKSKPQQNVSTDNRRMTGNVNIYICSEANENVKRKPPEKNKCCEESASESEMNSSTSASSLSTNKLMEALKKKRKKRNEAQDLECLCEEPEDIIATEKSTKRISECPDEMSSFSRSNSSNDNVSSEDYLDGCSLENCPALSNDDFGGHTTYDNDNPWDTRRTATKNYTFLPAERDIPVRDTSKEDTCCPCQQSKSPRVPCVCVSQQKVQSVATNYPENGLVRCDEQPKEVNEKQCCRTKNDPEEFTVCTNEPVEEFTVCGPPDMTNEETNPTEHSNEALKTEGLSTEGEDTTEKKESDTSQVLPTEPTDSGDTKRESFLVRSWKRAMTIVKRPRTSGPEANESDKSKTSQESKSAEFKNNAPGTTNQSLTIEPKSNSSSTLSQSSAKRRGKSKIVAKISDKQQQKRGSQSDSMLSHSSNQKIEVAPSPDSLENPQEEDPPKIDCECAPEEPKIVPCTFIQAEEPQSEQCCPSCNNKPINCLCCKMCCKPQEAGECGCRETQDEMKCCECRRETSYCICRQPAFKVPRLRKIACESCCNPINYCTCRAPARKCSCCGMPSDFCTCQPPCAKGRPMLDQNNNNGIQSNWKPRPGIPSRFLRERLNRENPDNCHCDQSKPYGSEELPYQKLNVFSNVMTELQQKISDSVTCDECNNTSCCCPKTTRYLNTIAERPSSPHRNDSALDYKCPRAKRKTTFAVCDNCRTSPCRCRRDKRPQAKCFYCKTMPCRCNWKYGQSRAQFDEDFGKRKSRGCRCLSPKRMGQGKDFVPQKHRSRKNWMD